MPHGDSLQPSCLGGLLLGSESGGRDLEKAGEHGRSEIWGRPVVNLERQDFGFAEHGVLSNTD